MSNFTTREAEGWIKDWPVEYKSKSRVEKVLDGAYAVSMLGILPVGALVVGYRVIEFVGGAL